MFFRSALMRRIFKKSFAVASKCVNNLLQITLESFEVFMHILGGFDFGKIGSEVGHLR